ncbi:hypothetical protein XELAEV_18011560mg [Xenopus laevis]|uniref:Uncharacterized protein n=1 Tax=Xenopus laevis TaxID=8355 RepID=A0A974HXK7_XENLA|nr:hypothetical protein XELAEV_18011560mg [Xenopus laevis]
MTLVFSEIKKVGEDLGKKVFSSTVSSTAKVIPSISEQEDILVRQQDESMKNRKKDGIKKLNQKVQELFHRHEDDSVETEKHQCNVLRQGFQRIEKKMDSVTGALNKVHKSILSLSQGMLSVARQTAAMNAELVKANNQMAATFQRLIELKELELSKSSESRLSSSHPTISNSSIMQRRTRARGGRRLSH